ncbi:universal stress protein [Rubrolithibacter danxiaensis]|uniref:universal stress protein n=1 Tax=Rubrolithibacter danxiaensis TaxID=3390805 RepID=UPI003BF78438
MNPLNQLHKILIAVEDSDYSTIATSYGFDLAKSLGAEVALLHVNDIPTGTPYVGDPILNEAPAMIPEIIAAQEETGKKLLNKIADTYGSNLTIYTFNKIGNPIDEILITAEEWNADMIILGTHGRTGIDHFISGSVAEKVIRKADCPVLIIPNKTKKGKGE